MSSPTPVPTPSYGGNRRIRRKAATHAALEDAALRLFAERGYEQTTIEDIAAAAGVAVRTFFRHFSSKQHVLFGDVAHGQIPALRAALHNHSEDPDPVRAVSAAMNELDLTDPADQAQVLVRFRLLSAQPGLFPGYLLLNAQLRDEVAEFVARHQGLRHTDYYPQLIAGAASASWDTALTTWVAAGGDADLTMLRRSAFAALTAGLEPDGGRADVSTRANPAGSRPGRQCP